MATTTTIRTLSADAAKQFPQIARQVLGNGGSTAITPYGGTSGAMFFRIDSHADDGTNVSRLNYSGKLYASSLKTATPIGGTVKARNTYEEGNTTSKRAGYDVHPGSTTCGDYTGIEPALSLVAYPVIDRVKIGDDWYVIFECKNDPIVYTGT